MAQPENTDPVAAIATAAPAPPTDIRSASDPSNPFLKFLDRVFLWIPNERAPGFLAVGLVLLRQATLPFVLVLAPMVVLVLIANSHSNPMPSASTAPGWFIPSLPPFVFGCMALVQELGRYAFVRRAERPMRAVAIFITANVVIILLFYHDRLYTCAWMVAAQLTASTAIVYALRRRPYIPAVIAALIIGQTAVTLIAPGFLRPTESAAQQAADRKRAASVSTAVPSAGNMASWAKLYPGAVLIRNETSKIFGLTDWRVTYRVQASPDQIGAFYQALATQEGFKDTVTVLGLHRFTQDSTRNDFSYFVMPDAGGSEVSFQARTFEGAKSGS